MPNNAIFTRKRKSKKGQNHDSNYVWSRLYVRLVGRLILFPTNKNKLSLVTSWGSYTTPQSTDRKATWGREWWEWCTELLLLPHSLFATLEPGLHVLLPLVNHNSHNHPFSFLSSSFICNPSQLQLCLQNDNAKAIPCFHVSLFVS